MLYSTLLYYDTINGHCRRSRRQEGGGRAIRLEALYYNIMCIITYTT